MTVDEALTRALQFHSTGALREAEELYALVLQAQPGNPDALHLLGVIAHQHAQHTRAVELIGRAIAIRPDFAAYHTNLGNALRGLRRLKEAEAELRRAVALDPSDPDPLINLGITVKEQNRHGEAVAAYEAALRLSPSSSVAWNNLGNALKDQGLTEQSVSAYRKAVALDPDYFEARSNLLFVGMNFSTEPAEVVLAEHRQWAAKFESAHRPPMRAASAKAPLRIGLVSPDLNDHPVGRFIAPLLDHLDRAEAEIICYSDAAIEDGVTQSLRHSADGWRVTAGASDEVFCQIVRADQIDILLDLAGHTAGNRLRAFARRPAPVQVTYLGYPGTTGMSSIDFRITDSIADPDGAEELHTERLIRIDPPFLCYRIAPDAPPVAPLPAEPRGTVTFGCFNNLAKVSDATLSAWARVLDAVPGSRMILKAFALNDPGTLDLTRRRLPSARIELCPPRATHLEHLGAYGEIDIALDTLGYNGTTTTCEALSMGVPVLTVAGTRHASRVGASVLMSIGRGDWVGRDVDDFVRIAAELAGNLSQLKEERATLRQRMVRSPLCDEQAYARRMEPAFRTMMSATSPAAQQR